MKKINRLLAILLAFAVVITTFSSDLTTARVFATEEETVIDSEDKINTVEKEEIETPVVAEASTEESTEETTVVPDEEKAEGEDGEENEDAAVTGADEEVVDPEAVVEEESKETEERVKEFKESKTIDGIEISLYAEPEVLPDDATLEIAKVEDDEEDQIQDLIDEELGDELKVKKTFSYDISIVSKETGETYKPEDGTVDVRFSRIQEAAPESVAMEVYHVNDELTEAESVSDVVEKGTEISFGAEHFSIYSVTLYYYDGDVDFNAGVYDINGNAIDKDNSIRKVKMSNDWSYPYKYPSAVAPIMNGYTFDHATFLEKNVLFFYVYSNGALYASLEDEEYDYYVNPDDEEAVKFYYRNTGATDYVTTDHIDLGFTDTEMPKVKKVVISINNHEFEMGAGVTEDDLGVVEKRLKLPAAYGRRHDEVISSVSTSDTIKFTVYVEENTTPGPGRPGVRPGKSEDNWKAYEYTCTTEENKNAFERCKNAHTYRQTDFGFDYKFNFREKFNYGAKVKYHNNFGDNDVTKEFPVTWDTQTQGGKKSVNLVTNYSSAEVGDKPNPDCTFLGWGTSSNATQPVTSVEVTNGETKDVYAIWKKYTVKFVDSENPQGMPYNTQNVFEGGNANPDLAGKPDDKGNKTFDKWMVYGLDHKLSVEYDFGKVTKDTIVYATWKDKNKNITVKGTYYFGTDPEKSNVTLGNPQPFAVGGTVTVDDIKNYADGFKTNSGKKYELKGIYTDAALKNEFKGITNLQADTTLYAKFVRSDRDELGFFILTANKTPDWTGQNSSDYYPANSALDWKGSALSMDKLSGYKQSDNYRAIYNWNGIDKNTIKYEYAASVKNSINSYITSNFGENFSESDVIWYVYKKKTGKNPYTHIDGYVATDITYYANNGTDASNTVATDKDGNYIRYGSTINVAANTYTNGNRQFIGWNTSDDGTGSWYGTNPTNMRIVLNDKVKLYAQWTDEIDYTVNFIIQDEDGAFSTEDGANIYKTDTYTLQMSGDSVVPVSAMKYGEHSYNKNADLKFVTDANRHVTSFSPRFKANGVGYTVVEEKWEVNVENDGTKTYVINVKFTRDDLNIKLTLTSKSQSFVYDGTEHVYNAETPSYTYDNSGNKDYVVTSVELDGKVKDVSAETNNNVIKKFTVKDTKTNTEYTYKVVDNKVVTLNNKPVNGIAVDFGTLSITARPVTLTSTTITKEFDGRALTPYNSKQKDAKKITPSETIDLGDKHEGFVAGEGIDDSKITFTGSRTIVGGEGEKENVFDDKDGDDTVFTALKSNTKPENYKITKEYGDIVVSDRSDKYVVYVKLGADGTGGKTTLTYNGTEQEADLSVKVYAQKTLLEKAKEAGERVVSTLLNLGVLVVNAEEGDETPAVIEGTKLDPVNDEIDGMKVVIDNLYVSGGKGTYVGHYPVWLNTKHMTIMTNIDGEPYDISKQVKIEVVNDAPAVVEQEENSVRALSVSERDQDSLTRIGELEITQATLTIKADDKTKVEGEEDPKFTSKLSGLVGEDKQYQKEVEELSLPYVHYEREGKLEGKEAPGTYKIIPSAPTSEDYGEQERVVPRERDLSALEAASDELERLQGREETFVLTEEQAKELIDNGQGLQSGEEIEMPLVFRMRRNYKVVFENGTLTITARGGGDDDDDDDDDTTTTIEDTPVAAAPAPAVLGAQRAPATGEAPAVLGARRAGTSDTSVLGSIITIIVAAAIAFSMIFIKRKKREEK